MHELSIAEGIIEIVERTCRSNGVKRVKSVRIAVGELAGVDIPSLQFAWESVKKGGPADKAALVIERPPGEAWCMSCGKTVPLKRYGDPCPFCGGFQLAATGGTDMRVLDLIEDEADSSEERDAATPSDEAGGAAHSTNG